MPVDETGQKWSCQSCIRGHRAHECKDYDRWMLAVKGPGRPANCQHPNKDCACNSSRISLLVAIPKVKPCECVQGKKKSGWCSCTNSKCFYQTSINKDALNTKLPTVDPIILQKRRAIQDACTLSQRNLPSCCSSGGLEGLQNPGSMQRIQLQNPVFYEAPTIEDPEAESETNSKGGANEAAPLNQSDHDAIALHDSPRPFGPPAASLQQTGARAVSKAFTYANINGASSLTDSTYQHMPLQNSQISHGFGTLSNANNFWPNQPATAPSTISPATTYSSSYSNTSNLPQHIPVQYRDGTFLENQTFENCNISSQQMLSNQTMAEEMPTFAPIHIRSSEGAPFNSGSALNNPWTLQAPNVQHPGMGIFQYPPGEATMQNPMTPQRMQQIQYYHLQRTAAAAQSSARVDYSNTNPLNHNRNYYITHHAHECLCGPGCRCLACAAHPFNNTTRRDVTEAYATMREDDLNYSSMASNVSKSAAGAVSEPQMVPGVDLDIGGGGDQHLFSTDPSTGIQPGQTNDVPYQPSQPMAPAVNMKHDDFFFFALPSEELQANTSINDQSMNEFQ